MEAGQLDLEARLLARLANRRGGRRLAEVHEPAGKRPQPAPGVDGPSRQQHGAVLLGEGRADDLRAQVEDEAAARAHLLLALVRGHGLGGERGAAEGTEADRRRGEDAMPVIVAHAEKSTPVGRRLP